MKNKIKDPVGLLLAVALGIGFIFVIFKYGIKLQYELSHKSYVLETIKENCVLKEQP